MTQVQTSRAMVESLPSSFKETFGKIFKDFSTGKISQVNQHKDWDPFKKKLAKRGCSFLSFSEDGTRIFTISGVNNCRDASHAMQKHFGKDDKGQLKYTMVFKNPMYLRLVATEEASQVSMDL